MRSAAIAPIIAGVALTSLTAAADVEVQCARLAKSEADELGARAQLLLEANRRAQELGAVSIDCDAKRSWVDCAAPVCARTIAIDETSGIVEGALDALEVVLRDTRRVQRGSEAPTSALLGPDEIRASDTRRGPALPTGGLGLGVSGEPVPGRDLAIGPRLDVGFGAGALAGFATEGFRIVTGSGHDALLIDTQLGMAYGAPYAPRHVLGVAVSGGFEWLTSGTAAGDASGQTDSSAVATIGARSRMRVDAFALWVGVDLKGRAKAQELGSPIDLSLARADRPGERGRGVARRRLRRVKP